MYKILLADDEGIVLDALAFIIERNFKGLCSLQTAKSGRKVIELSETFHPEIALIDIQMAGINGIEAMKEIRKKNEEMILIVLTAYDIFDYAKEAVNLGVLEYLNKPIEKSEIVRVLNRAMKLIEERRKKRQEELKQKEAFHALLPMIETGFIQDLIGNTIQEHDFNQSRQLLGIRGEYGFVLLLKFNQNINSHPSILSKQVPNYLKKHFWTIRELIKDELRNQTYSAILVGAVQNTMIPVFLVMRECQQISCADTVFEQDSLPIETAIAKRIEDSLPLTVQISLGNVHPIKDASYSYEEAIQELVQTNHKTIRADISSQKAIQKEESLVGNAKHYIQKNFQRDISLDEVAEALHISSYYLSRLFKKETGENFIDYLTEIRLDFAKKLLLETNQSIQSVCTASGYTDPNYFSRIFKKHVGVTPSVFKEGYTK